MDIDLTRLKYFVATAEELHFKRAADRLRITPSPLSKQIKLLEQELGGELFERHYHDVTLTQFGRSVLPHAVSVLNEVERLKDAVKREFHPVAPLRIGMTAYAPSNFLERFEEGVQHLSVEASADIVGSAADVTAQLIAGNLDLGLIHLPSIDDRLLTEVVAAYQGAVAVRADDPLAEHEVIDISDLADRELVIDFSRRNPLLLAQMARRLRALGVTRFAHTPTDRSSELELANYAYNRRLAVLLLAYEPNSLIGRIFSPPEFKLVPISEETWEGGRLALAWTALRAEHEPRIPTAVGELRALLTP